MGDDALRIAGVVERPRLYDILDSPLVRVWILQGASGSGKTTLMRSWALQRSGSLTWVALGDGGMSRQAFWRNVVGSARRLGSLSPDTAARLIDQLTLTADPVAVAIDLLADAGPVALVLDAYEHLGDVTPQVDADLSRLVMALPDLRLFITTRGPTALADIDPPGGVVRVLTPAELAMTSAEIAALMAAQTGISDERLVSSVTDATRGFPLTVRAVALAISQLGRIPNVDTMAWDVVVKARWESLLPNEAAVDFVSQTSIPPYVTTELASRLTGHPAPQSLLDDLERQGFGRWIPWAHDRPVFQYAETIRETFRTRAKSEIERFRGGCTLTAQWLFENDEVDQALVFAVEGGDYAFADRTIVALVIGNPDTYITDRFLPTLQAVPTEALEQHPMLAFGLGLALAANPLQRLEAPRAFQIALASTARPAYIEPTIDALSHDGMRAVARRLAFDFHGSARASAQVVRMVDALGTARLEQFGEHVGTILRQLSLSLLQGGLVDDAIGAALRSVSMCTSQTTRNYSTVYAAGASAFAGDSIRARDFRSRTDLDAWPVNLRLTYLNGMGVVAEAFELLDQFDFAGAMDALRATRSYTPTGEFWPFFTAISISARHGLGQARAEAERVTRELAGPRPPGTGDNVATDHLYAVLARAWMASGDLRAAKEVLERRPPGLPHLAGARISALLEDERTAEALRLADGSLRLSHHTIRTRADISTVGAVAALREGEKALAWQWLNDAAVTGESSGARLHVATLPARHRQLLWELAAEHRSAAVHRYLEVPRVAGQAGAVATVKLTEREAIVLRSLATLGSIREIAQELVVSPHTIKTQLTGLYRKLGVTSRQGALSVARELGLLGDSA